MKCFTSDKWMIPNDWNEVTLGDLTSDWRGGASLTPEDFRDEGFPILHKGAIQKNGRILVDAKKKTFATEAYALKSPKSIVDGSFLAATLRDLVPSGPSIGLIADLDKSSHPQYLLAQGAYGFKIDRTRIDPAFLVQLSNYAPFRAYIKRYAVGSTQIHIRTPVFQSLRIPLPPLDEQKRIAEVLDKADALRQKRRLALQKLDTLLQSVFLEMFGDPVKNPKGWEVSRLKDITTHILSGNTPTGGKQVYKPNGVTFFRSQNVWRNKLELDDIAYIDEGTHRRMAKSSLKNKDILITKTGRFNTENSSLGRAAIFLGQNDSANINGHVYLVRLKATAIHEFVLFILTTNEYREYIRRVCVGGIDKRQINKDHLEEFPIISPPVDLQRRFASVIEVYERQKSHYVVQLAELDALFFSLQHRAFKGELFETSMPSAGFEPENAWQQTSHS